MKALFALVDLMKVREQELTEGLVTRTPATIDEVRYVIGQIHESRHCQDELRKFFRMKDEEDL